LWNDILPEISKLPKIYSQQNYNNIIYNFMFVALFFNGKE